MVVYDKHNYFYLGILISICLLVFLAIFLTYIKPDFTRFKLTFAFGSGPGFTQKIKDYYNKLFENKYKKLYEQLLEENRSLKFHNDALKVHFEANKQLMNKFSKENTQFKTENRAQELRQQAGTVSENERGNEKKINQI